MTSVYGRLVVGDRDWGLGVYDLILHSDNVDIKRELVVV